jgi:lysophospholipase L1-like esterase
VARFALISLALAALAGAGCGDDGAPVGEPTPPGEDPGLVSVAALGDSITAGNPLYDPDPAQREALGFGAEPESQYEYWAAEVEPALDFTNCGVFGERTDQIARRLAECADGMDVVIVQGGINDIAQALGPDPQATQEAVSAAAANIDGMLSEAENLGLDTAVANVLPWNNGHPEADAAIEELNSVIARIAERRGVPLLDFHAALESRSRPDTMAPGYTDDGDHPSVEGYRILGELVADELQPPRS